MKEDMNFDTVSEVADESYVAITEDSSAKKKFNKQKKVDAKTELSASEDEEVIVEVKNNENSAIKKELDKQAKVEVKIVLNEAEKELVASKKTVPDVQVCINGYTYQIKKGISVKVPKSVALILEEAGLI